LNKVLAALGKSYHDQLRPANNPRKNSLTFQSYLGGHGVFEGHFAGQRVLNQTTDLIYVIEEGAVSESRTDATLRKAKGVYATM